jgi:hypothetical protein
MEHLRIWTDAGMAGTAIGNDVGGARHGHEQEPGAKKKSLRT